MSKKRSPRGPSRAKRDALPSKPSLAAQGEAEQVQVPEVADETGTLALPLATNAGEPTEAYPSGAAAGVQEPEQGETLALPVAGGALPPDPLEAQIVAIQEQIREGARQRAEMLNEDETSDLTEIDARLARLRQERQGLLDEQLRLRRELVPPAPPESSVAVVPPASAKRSVQRAQGSPPLLIRVVTLLLVLAGVGVLSVAGLLYLFEQIQPPPIAAVEGQEADGVGEEFPITGDQSIEERGLAIYLSLNRDAIARTPSDDPTPIVFTVELGETAVTIAERLQEEGFIEDAELFRRLLTYREADQSLEAGVFELARNMTMDEIIVALQEGRLQEATFTFLEGWRAEQMAALLEEQGLVNAADYMALVREPSRFDYDFLKELPAGSTLEGYLFPDTYRIVQGEASAESIIRLQLDNFATRLTPELRTAAATNGMTLHEAVILASIVEREAVVAEERETIAGVYLNRWNDGTVLNADPTIQYALGFQAETGEWWKRPLTREDLALESPYNTYINAGLPPGPIDNPGLDSLRATIVAPATDFYYFVSRNDGTHVFAVTFEEHLANVALYQSGE